MTSPSPLTAERRLSPGALSFLIRDDPRNLSTHSFATGLIISDIVCCTSILLYSLSTPLPGNARLFQSIFNIALVVELATRLCLLLMLANPRYLDAVRWVLIISNFLSGTLFILFTGNEAGVEIVFLMENSLRPFMLFRRKVERARFLTALAMSIIAGVLLLALATFSDPLVDFSNPETKFVVRTFVMIYMAIFSAQMVLLHLMNQRRLRTLELEKLRNDRLLLNVIPGSIASRLRTGDELIAEYHDNISILFADLTGFTSYCNYVRNSAPVVENLNEVFSMFDDLCGRHGCEKIKTIGDGYMVISGAPVSETDHARRICALAIDMMTNFRHCVLYRNHAVRLRIGISSGGAVGGVIGSSKFCYDVWGEAVNIASGLENAADSMTILVSEATRELAGDSFTFDRAVTTTLKGGPVRALHLEWEATGRRTGANNGT